MPRKKTSRFPFTTARLRNLPVPAKGKTYHHDAKTKGLCVCVRATGSVIYEFYKWIDGRPRRIRLGRFPDLPIDAARKAAVALAGEVAKGRDPAADRREKREAATLQELFDYWMETYARQKKKTWRDDDRIFNKYFGRLKTKRLTDVKTSAVLKWHSDLGKKHGPYQANRARALLSAMWASAKHLDCEANNPCQDVAKFKEESRDRYLQPAEMRRFFQALTEEQPLWRDFFLLCLFTGARRGNVAAMRWENVDLDAATWYVPGHETKGGDPLVIVLPPPAVTVLEARREARDDSSPWVFASKGRSKQGRVVDPRKAWARVIKRAGIDNLRMHDLRRSLGSWQAAAGTSLAIIGKSLGHRDHKSTAVYARLQLDPVRASVDAAVAGMLEAGGGLKLEDDKEANDV